MAVAKAMGQLWVRDKHRILGTWTNEYELHATPQLILNKDFFQSCLVSFGKVFFQEVDNMVGVPLIIIKYGFEMTVKKAKYQYFG